MSLTLIELLDPQHPWMLGNTATHGNEHQCVRVTGGTIEDVHEWVKESEIACRVAKYYDYNGDVEEMVLLFRTRHNTDAQARRTNDDFMRFKMAWSGDADYTCQRLNQWIKCEAG